MRQDLSRTPNPKPGCSRSDVQARRAVFVENFIASGNATQAALQAGFSPRTAGQQGSRLLKLVEVQQEISARRTARIKKFELSTDRVLRELSRIVFLDPRQFFNRDGTMKAITELDEDCAAGIASLVITEIKDEKGVITGCTRKIRFWDKNAALQKAMTKLGLFTERRDPHLGPLYDLTPEETREALEMVNAAIRNAQGV